MFLIPIVSLHIHILTIFADLAKAFDTVPISILMLKLEAIGIRNTQLQFFRSLLSGRTQLVKINDNYSDELPISYGVPQGSIIGPTLFSIFINDLCNISLYNGSTVSYADDTALTFFGDSWTELQDIAQRGFDTINSWLLTHFLTLNASKTKFINFSIRPASQPKTPLVLVAHSCFFTHSCQCPLIIPTDNIKYLGIIVDKLLNFKAHIDTLTGRVRKLIYIFKNLRDIANTFVIRKIYYALCQSLISYCISCWGGVPKTTLKPLEVAQRAILKVSSFKPLLYPTTQLYRECNVLTVRQLFIVNTILQQHRKTPYHVNHKSKRRCDLICVVPFTKFKSIKHYFYYLGPYLYNRINREIFVYSMPYVKCKKNITRLFLTKTYDETEKYFNQYI